MRKVVISVVFVLCYIAVYSQYDIGGNGSTYSKARDVRYKAKINNFTQNSSPKIRMNFFLNEEWNGGVLFNADSTIVKGCSYRYNIYSDQIELRTVVNPTDINLVSIGSKKFIYLEYYDQENVLNEGYFEKISDGDCLLLVRREVDYKKGTCDIQGYGANEGSSIKEELYIKKNDKPAIKIVKTKDFFENIMFDKKEVLTYLDKKLILFMTRNKIKDIVKYYNEN